MSHRTFEEEEERIIGRGRAAEKNPSLEKGRKNWNFKNAGTS